MTTIRPNPLPLSGHGPQAQDHGKLAAQRQFFAAAVKQAQGVTDPAATSVAAAPQTVQQPASPQAPDAPQKVLRPGSLIDIRV